MVSHSLTRRDSRTHRARLATPRRPLVWALALFIVTFVLGFVAKATPTLRMAGVDVALNSFASPFATTVAKILDKLDKPTVVGGILVVVFIVLIPLVGWRRGLGTCVVTGLGWITTLPIKSIVAEPRPSFTDLPHEIHIHAATLSYPSGHVVFVTALVTALFFVSTRRFVRVVIFIVGGIFIVAVAWSRLYLGVHYTTDVIGGFINGVAGVLLMAGLWNLVFARGKTTARPAAEK